jgi:hypothetical protein
MADTHAVPENDDVQTSLDVGVAAPQNGTGNRGTSTDTGITGDDTAGGGLTGNSADMANLSAGTNPETASKKLP